MDCCRAVCGVPAKNSDRECGRAPWSVAAYRCRDGSSTRARVPRLRWSLVRLLRWPCCVEVRLFKWYLVKDAISLDGDGLHHHFCEPTGHAWESKCTAKKRSVAAFVQPPR